MAAWTSERLKQLKTRAGFTATELAQRCRVSEGAARHWLAGRRRITGPVTLLLDSFEQRLADTPAESTPN